MVDLSTGALPIQIEHLSLPDDQRIIRESSLHPATSDALHLQFSGVTNSQSFSKPNGKDCKKRKAE
jgi:hypothetical protein